MSVLSFHLVGFRWSSAYHLGSKHLYLLSSVFTCRVLTLAPHVLFNGPSNSLLKVYVKKVQKKKKKNKIACEGLNTIAQMLSVTVWANKRLKRNEELPGLPPTMQYSHLLLRKNPNIWGID